ncbi:MAG TPA: DUF4292 domain-containing protein [Thermodesulfobacteriota bacterium]|nr:DUF4292 domain-containing protein [Thermodesulfobacteriota bacterium]
MNRPVFPLLFLLVAALAASCATVPILPEATPSAPELLAKVAETQNAITGLKGLADVKVSSPAGNLSSSQALFARRPDAFRTEALSPLGTPILYAVSRGGEIDLYVPQENRYYRGPFRAGSRSLSLPPDLAPEEIVSFLLGGAPIAEYEETSVRADRQKGLWVIELRSPAQKRELDLWVQPASFSVVRAAVRNPKLSYDAAFSQFREEKGILFPRRMLLVSDQPRIRLAVSYQEVELNPSWEDQDFVLPVPPGTTVIQLQ